MPGEWNKRDVGKRCKSPPDAESSFHSALTGDDFSPGTTESQQLAISKVRDFSKRPKKNAGKRTRGVGISGA